MWLDSERDFGEHVARVALRAKIIANNLSRLLPNLGEASDRVRCLYTAMIHSVLMYAAPVWWKKVGDSNLRRGRMEAAQRVIARSAARAYRTVAHVGATAVAGISPVHLIARAHSKVYDRVRAIREEQGQITPRARTALIK
ncbi:uncharacterized protein LOC112455080 [Temnothorax curvispinosus]|uniref:Uncharacterized protein LOC112455080 n=1 Tax=Temnothorax curvispinosus TaxID=300111 RepID=A0A6J1PS03_9HYME|nr:uncharacterized protein LOC112455080 [Temnothorax curvispinosus]